MNLFRKLVAFAMLLWMPLFFSASSYAATQMDFASALSFKTADATSPCHDLHEEIDSSHQDMTHNTEDSNCQHCGYCLSFAMPLSEIKTNIISQMPTFAFKAMWVSSSQNITPNYRPPIDA